MTTRDASLHLALLWVIGCAPCPRVSSVIDVQRAAVVPLSEVRTKDGEDFTGTYFSPQSGVVELSQRGELVAGRYRFVSCACELRGTILGHANGNRAQVTWHEQPVNCDGAPREAFGYLYLVSPKAIGDKPRIFGEQNYVRSSWLRSTAKTYDAPSVWSGAAISATSAEAMQGEHCP